MLNMYAFYAFLYYQKIKHFNYTQKYFQVKCNHLYEDFTTV